jgi:hypothetical protein
MRSLILRRQLAAVSERSGLSVRSRNGRFAGQRRQNNMNVPAKLRTAALAATLMAVAVPSFSTSADAAWGWRGGGWRGGWGWGGLGVGLAAGALFGAAIAAP